MSLASRKTSWSDALGVSSLSAVGTELPRVLEPRYCVKCQELKGICHRISSYAPKGTQNCSLWNRINATRDEVPGRKPRAASATRTRRTTESLMALRPMFSAIAAHKKRDPAIIFEAVHRSVEHVVGCKPQALRKKERRTDGPRAHVVAHACRIASCALMAAFDWRNAHIASHMKVSSQIVSTWLKKVSMLVNRRDTKFMAEVELLSIVLLKELAQPCAIPQ